MNVRKEYSFFVIKGPEGYLHDFDWSLGAPDDVTWGGFLSCLQYDSRAVAEDVLKQFEEFRPGENNELLVEELFAYQVA